MGFTGGWASKELLADLRRKRRFGDVHLAAEGLGVWALFRVWGLGLRVRGLEFRVWGVEFRVSGFGFRVWGLGSRLLPGVSVILLL